MLKEWNPENAIRLLEVGISNIKNFGCRFVAYNTKFAGASYSEDFEIQGKSTRGSKHLHEFCYGYDGQYHQLHLLHVYETPDGMKFAMIEVSNGVYAFWEILE